MELSIHGGQSMFRHILMASAIFGLLLAGTPAYAGMIKDTYADASAIAAQVKNSTDYHGLLAKKLAYAAMEEVGQHDTKAAQIFIGLARSEAAKAGGNK